MPLFYWLIVYDRVAQRIADIERFEDAEEASAAYARKEVEQGKRLEYEVVLLGADSLDTLKTTHSRYFSHEVATPF